MSHVILPTDKQALIDEIENLIKQLGEKLSDKEDEKLSLKEKSNVRRRASWTGNSKLLIDVKNKIEKTDPKEISRVLQKNESTTESLLSVFGKQQDLLKAEREAKVEFDTKQSEYKETLPGYNEDEFPDFEKEFEDEGYNNTHIEGIDEVRKKWNDVKTALKKLDPVEVILGEYVLAATNARVSLGLMKPTVVEEAPKKAEPITHHFEKEKEEDWEEEFGDQFDTKLKIRESSPKIIVSDEEAASSPTSTTASEGSEEEEDWAAEFDTAEEEEKNKDNKPKKGPG